MFQNLYRGSRGVAIALAINIAAGMLVLIVLVGLVLVSVVHEGGPTSGQVFYLCVLVFMLYTGLSLLAEVVGYLIGPPRIKSH